MSFDFAKRVIPITGSAIREIFNMLAVPGIISLAGGNPSPKSFPCEDATRIAHDLLERHGAAILQYGATEGWAALRETLVERNRAEGVDCALENVIILTGSSQGIDLLSKCFLNEGDVVLQEDPTFLGATQTFRTYMGVPVGVKTDQEGIIPEDLEAKIKERHPKLLYTIPTFQNPSGVTASLERRKQVYALCKRYGVIIMEDDPYGELRYEGQPLPYIKTLDEDGDTVVLLKSFSKTISPGMRVGYATGHKDIIRKMAIIKQGADIHTPNLNQAIMNEFLTTGLYEPHVAQTCDFYRVQRDAMFAALDKYLPQGVTYTRPQGGLFIWLELPEHVKVMPIFKEAVERGVAFVPGEHFFADLSGKNTFRLNFSMPSVEQIDEGCAILGKLLREYI